MTDNNLELSQVKGSVVIIPAAGIGQRFGGNTPKQYQMVGERRVLDITLDLFLSSDDIEKVVLIISPEDDEYKNLHSILDDKVIVIDGGDERHSSVFNGLRYLYDNGLPDQTPLLVHDAVRPCLSSRDLDSLLNYFRKENKACFLAETVADSLKKIDQDGLVLNSVERQDLVRALTPQLAAFIDIKNSYSSIIKAGINITDDIGALTNCNIPVQAVFANDLNPKITLKKDLELVQFILLSREVV